MHFPFVNESFQGCYTELDFSENSPMKLKLEFQNPPFHVFTYKPSSHSIYMKEYFCSFGSCLELKFENCENLIIGNLNETTELNQFDNHSRVFDEEWIPDENFANGNHQNAFDFIILPKYVILITGNILQLSYILKIVE